MKRLQLLLVVVVLCTLALPGASAHAARTYSGDTMIDAVNWARASAGLRPLKHSRRLTRSARSRADLMMRADFFAHPSLLRVPTFDRVGEVLELHGGRRPHVRAVLRRWANSPGHRAVLTARHFRWIGAARAKGRFMGYRATIWVVRLGKH